ncbi:phosphatidylglycerophosphatase A [Maribius pontilimi]|uniref:Phosphatidylglycerophosphatase A n=1 Tax=Palleronia pontilimi TaxID=1964209 RepID=A0A934IHY8_9RHOB|nr:phosphatidylglycerophosphatase A [Palleronia pontilimi]MBJ3762905.1 phosphatidylglycerophosphatase A [Palleronia pontilimi]
MNRLVTTFFYAGLLKPAPGTWGSAAALPVAWLLHVVGGPWLLALGAGVAFFWGLKATTTEVARLGQEDPSEIVIDEVVGQWIALLPISIGAAHAGVAITALWPGWIAAFALFRLFDILKPGPVGWADRRGDPLGVMLDDVIAGVFAALGVIALAALAHGVLA